MAASSRAAKRQAADDLRTRTCARRIGRPDEAGILGVDPSTVVKWANRGKFQAFRYAADGKTTLWRFARADIVALVEQSRIRPPWTNGAIDPDLIDG